MDNEPLAPSVRRSGALVLAASLVFVGHAANYFFYIVTARTLSVGELAQITALTSLGTMVFRNYSADSGRDGGHPGAAGVEQVHGGEGGLVLLSGRAQV